MDKLVVFVYLYLTVGVIAMTEIIKLGIKYKIYIYIYNFYII